MIPKLLHDAEKGDTGAAASLFAALYKELHDIAEWHLKKNSADLTLGTTTLLHEAYLQLSAREGAEFPDRARFMAYASKAMRGLLIDYCRARRAKKRGGEFEITRIGDQDPAAADAVGGEQLDRINEAVEQLAALDARLAEVVDLHFFSGFSFREIAELRGVSDRTVERDWRKARMVLQRFVEVAP